MATAISKLRFPWIQQPLVLLSLLIVWHVFALQLEHQLLPTPMAVIETIGSEFQSGQLGEHIGATLIRVVISFSIAMLIGTAIGIAMGLLPRLNRLTDPLLVLLLNIPALVVILLFYLWIGLSETAAIAAVVLNKVPNVVVTLRQGTMNLDHGYKQLASVYRLTPWCQLRDIILPQLTPYFLIAARSGLALIWKIVLVVELLGRSDGVGFQLHLAFQMFDVVTILAYSLTFIVIVQAIEWGILQPWERRQSRWQQGAEC